MARIEPGDLLVKYCWIYLLALACIRLAWIWQSDSMDVITKLTWCTYDNTAIWRTVEITSMTDSARIHKILLIFGCRVGFDDDMFGASRARHAREPKLEPIQIALRSLVRLGGATMLSRVRRGIGCVKA